MRTVSLSTFILLAALALGGCVMPTASGGLSIGSQAATPASAAATPAASPTPVASTFAAPNEPVSAAVQAVIRRANEEQQEAFAKRDPSIMADTATRGYLAELTQINRDMADSGVTAIELINIEWGPITQPDATTASATTFETWRTTFADGSTDQRRERNVYTLVLDQGVWKIQSDGHPDSGFDVPPGQAVPAPAAPAPTAPSRSRQPTPATPVPPSSRAPADQSSVSHNWSGYAATGGTYTSVAGTWTVPEAQMSGAFSSGATWVGIGGVRSRDLIQAGTQETSLGGGRVRYQAWIETLPEASRPIPLRVTPGDSVTVSIAEQASGTWQIAVKNNTTGEDYQTTVQYTSSHSSAEWIVEAPSAGRRLLPLDDFGTVQFTGGSTVKDGKSATIAESGARPLTMIDGGGQALATPSGLTADGRGFSVSRTDVSAVPNPQPAPGRRIRPFSAPSLANRAR